MAFMQPDRFFSRITRIDVDRDILARGFKHVLLDVDNTILTRDTCEVPRDVAGWLARARDKGVTFCLVSNNWHESVYQLADRLELPLVAKSVKPLPPAFLMALSKLDAKREETVVVGDQLVTDCMGAHFLGMTMYMVLPLVEADLKHTLMLRHVEKLFIGHLRPEDQPDPAPEGACAAVVSVSANAEEQASGGSADAEGGAAKVAQ